MKLLSTCFEESKRLIKLVRSLLSYDMLLDQTCCRRLSSKYDIPGWSITSFSFRVHPPTWLRAQVASKCGCCVVCQEGSWKIDENWRLFPLTCPNLCAWSLEWGAKNSDETQSKPQRSRVAPKGLLDQNGWAWKNRWSKSGKRWSIIPSRLT